MSLLLNISHLDTAQRWEPLLYWPFYFCDSDTAVMLALCFGDVGACQPPLLGPLGVSDKRPALFPGAGAGDTEVAAVQ